MWNAEMLEKIKYFDGSIQAIVEIPPGIREKYKEVFEIEPQWLIKAAAYRGRWIDQSQSLNIFYGGTSGKILSEIYQYAWGLGLKTTYYLRTLGASRIEKSTVNLAKFGGTSKFDNAVASNAGSVPSSVVIEETVIVATVRDPLDSIPSPIVMLEPSQIKVDYMAYAQVTAGIPTFGEQTIAVVNRPKIEIIGEVCENCSA